MAWKPLSYDQAYNRIGDSGKPNRHGFNARQKQNPRDQNEDPYAFKPNISTAADIFKSIQDGSMFGGQRPTAEQAWYRDMRNVLGDNSPSTIYDYEWHGDNPSGYDGNAWDASTPQWAQNVWEHARAKTVPRDVMGAGLSPLTSMWNLPTTTPGFTAPPEGWDGPEMEGSFLRFSRNQGNWLNGSGVTLPSGDWTGGTIDTSKPNWSNPDSGAWNFIKEAKDTDMGGLGMIGGLAGAMTGLGFGMPSGAFQQSPGNSSTGLQATYTEPTQQQTPVSAVSNQLMQQSAANRAVQAQQAAQNKVKQNGLFNLGAISNYRR